MSDDPLAAVAASAERSARRLDRLEAEQRAQGEALAALAPAGQGDPVMPTMLAQPPAAVADLLDWLHDVYLQYDGTTLAPCWPWHPGVVEELTVLRGLHQLAYSAPAEVLRRGDWHDRYRPGAVRRVADATRGCHIDKHIPTKPEPSVPLGDALAPIAAARAARTPVPAPSSEHAAQARALTTRPKKPAPSTN